jgi:hypothetical protein
MKDLIKELYAHKKDGMFFSDFFPRAEEVYKALKGAVVSTPSHWKLPEKQEFDYKAALEALGKGDSVLYDPEGFAYGVDIEHTIRHALKLADTQGWQPIETAPRDKTIITYGHNGIRFSYKDDQGQFCSMMHRPFVKSPTHWMPLPETPAQKEIENE